MEAHARAMRESPASAIGSKFIDTFTAGGEKIDLPRRGYFSEFAVDIVDIGMPIAIISG